MSGADLRPEGGGHPWPVIAAASLGMFLVNLDFFALNLALPRIADGLHTTATDLQWVLSGYMLAFGSLLIPAGRLGDIFGRRKVLLAGLGVFAIASALCGSASSPSFLVAARVLQGAGGVLLYPMSIAVVTNAFPPERRKWAIGNLFGLAAVGTALGPVLGGAITEHLGWRWIFFVNIPVAAAAALMTSLFVRESRDRTAPRHVDLPGLLLVAGGIVAITLAVDRGEDWGWASVPTLTGFVLGPVLLTAFVLVEKRVRRPLVNLTLFRNAQYVVVTAAGAVSNIAYTTTFYASTLYLQQVKGLSPLVAGAVFLAPAAGVAAAGPLSGRLAGLIGPARVMAAAIGIGAVGLLVLSSVGGWPLYVPVFGLCGLGFGLGWSSTSVGTQEVVPPEEAGEASGVTLAVVIGIAAVSVTVVATVLELLQHAGRSEGHAIELVLRAVAIGSLVVALALGFVRAGSRRPG